MELDTIAVSTTLIGCRHTDSTVASGQNSIRQIEVDI